MVLAEVSQKEYTDTQGALDDQREGESANGSAELLLVEADESFARMQVGEQEDNVAMEDKDLDPLELHSSLNHTFQIDNKI